MTRPRDAFSKDHEFAAKEVVSLGGDRGFKHVEIEPPEELAEEIDEAIRNLYRNPISDKYEL
jgi:hypothetical protein